MKMLWTVIPLTLLLCLTTASSHAEIFRYTNDKGDTVFTDRLVSKPGYRLVWRSGLGGFASYTNPWKSRSTKRAAKPKWAKKKQFDPLIKRVAKKSKLSPELLHAVIQAESSYNPKAKSSAGAMGLMQLMPGTASRFGVSNAWDPVQNLEGGAKYLRELLDMFKNNLRLALAAYNAGENAVKKYGNRIPPYPETQDYVRKVIDFYMEERKQQRQRKKRELLTG
jgi:soluble lytic murein transglycosylase-like protein